MTHLLLWFALAVAAPGGEAPRFGVYEQAFEHAGDVENPYAQLSAVATFVAPDGRTTRSLPLFWDGGRTWRFRFSPDKAGLWKWSVQSNNPGLNGAAGEFDVVESDLAGGIQARPDFPRHFQRQNGDPFWFLGDTAWALYTDHDEEKHDRAAAESYIRRRAKQGFNVFHSMLLSEAGWGNRGGTPFTDLAAEQLNPAYWQEVDHRLKFLNEQGIVGGLALAWGDKRGREPYAWRRFSSDEARRRYAQYIAARYSAFNVYFIVSGEWHAEIGEGRPHEAVKAEFVALGNHLHEADPHGRMIAIHPMTSEGSVREFSDAPWMSFADYQQNYDRLHERALIPRPLNKPVVNSEYAYYLRAQSGDGKTDKPNSAHLDMIRHATWDIVMAGGYVVTGFGSTYFGGNRHPGPFNAEDPRNADWEKQVQLVKTPFEGISWWKLTPRDDLITAAVDRSADRKEAGVTAPPQVAYWLLADPGACYVAYVRGHKGAFKLTLAEDREVAYLLRQYNPRTGEFASLGKHSAGGPIFYSSPDDQDWVLAATAE
jgi:hypothetical protein